MTRKSDPRRALTWKDTEILSDRPLRARDVILVLLLSSVIVIPTWIMIWSHLP